MAGIIDVESGFNLDPFISVANILVTKFCTGDSVEDVYSVAILAEIETWLAAHFYTVYDPRAETEKADTVAAKYQSKVDVGLKTSHYGQMAMIIDYQGGLSANNEAIMSGNAGIKIDATWLGTEKDDAEEFGA